MTGGPVIGSSKAPILTLVISGQFGSRCVVLFFCRISLPRTDLASRSFLNILLRYTFCVRDSLLAFTVRGLESEQSKKPEIEVFQPYYIGVNRVLATEKEPLRPRLVFSVV